MPGWSLLTASPLDSVIRGSEMTKATAGPGLRCADATPGTDNKATPTQSKATSIRMCRSLPCRSDGDTPLPVALSDGRLCAGERSSHDGTRTRTCASSEAREYAGNVRTHPAGCEASVFDIRDLRRRDLLLS